jgi:hypothetical protein
LVTPSLIYFVSEANRPNHQAIAQNVRLPSSQPAASAETQARGHYPAKTLASERIQDENHFI